MTLSARQICEQLGLKLEGSLVVADLPLSAIEFDTRLIRNGRSTCFITFQGSRSGIEFLSNAYEIGVRVFWCQEKVECSQFPDACFIFSADTLTDYQILAAKHIKHSNLPLVGIAGSNGKTIVKEWLAQLLQGFFAIVKSPKSFNSQIGVPYSLLLTEAYHTLGIFETGVSRSGEMEKLARIFMPDIGIFTNIGTAHDEGFSNREQKLVEKLSLFQTSRFLVYHIENKMVHEFIRQNLLVPECITWSWKSKTGRQAIWTDGFIEIVVELPFSDLASLENLGHCLGCLKALDMLSEDVLKRVALLENIPLRLSSKRGLYNTQIIDDSYSNDIAGLKIALDFQEQNKALPEQKKAIVLSEMNQSGMTDEACYKQVFELLDQYNIDHRFVIGHRLTDYVEKFKPQNTRAFQSVEAVLEQVSLPSLSHESILIKGNRISELEAISKKWQAESHGSLLEVNLDALRSNLQYIRSLLPGNTKIMAMVKAFAYGSGAEAVARMLEYNRVDYLGVAYTDEGVHLRQCGIKTPIMVMNPSEEGFEDLILYNLEPVVFSFQILKRLVEFLKVQAVKGFKVHIEIDTGMNRLGFGNSDWGSLVAWFSNQPLLKPISVFSHLAGSENPEHDAFTQKQIESYFHFVGLLNSSLPEPVSLTHIQNSEGILRFPQTGANMVRLGIALYGISDQIEQQSHLQLAARWVSRVAQVREITAGDSVSYGRTFVADKPMTIATVDLGYADGFHRSLSNAIGQLKVKGEWRPILGRICMDMCMIDVTGLNMQEGDEVVIFDDPESIKRLAGQQQTIPYEVLTSIGQRVKRVYLSGV